MESRQKLLSTSLIVVAGAIVANWQCRTSNRLQVILPSSSTSTSTPVISNTHITNMPVVPSKSGGLTQPALSVLKDTRRELLRTSRNYAQLVRELAAAASAGDATAQYLMANASRYCDQHLKIFHRQDGSTRSLNEVQARRANLPAGYQQELNDAYERCRDFLETPADLEPTSSWLAWLDKADAAGFPPAQSEKADDMRVLEGLKDAAEGTGGDIVPTTLGPARDHALAAATSGDPDTLFRMANWVDGTRHSQEDYIDLTSAWTLLACQRGYDDCGSNSEWIRSMCSFDPQCVDVDNATDYFQRHLGSHFDDVQQLAEQIGNAVDARDLNAIAAFL